MRSFLLLTTLFLFTLQKVSLAQDYYLGIKGGYHLAEMTSDITPSDISLKTLNGFNIAVVMAYAPADAPIGFSIEPGYTLKGTDTSVDTLKYRFNYLSLPVMLDYYPIRNVRLSAGPEVSILTGAKNLVNDTTKTDISTTYDRNIEISGSVGLNYSVTYYMDLGVKYNLAFTKIASSDAILNRRNLFNRYFQISLMLKIAN